MFALAILGVLFQNPGNELRQDAEIEAMIDIGKDQAAFWEAQEAAADAALGTFRMIGGSLAGSHCAGAPALVAISHLGSEDMPSDEPATRIEPEPAGPSLILLGIVFGAGVVLGLFLSRLMEKGHFRSLEKERELGRYELRCRYGLTSLEHDWWHPVAGFISGGDYVKRPDGEYTNDPEQQVAIWARQREVRKRRYLEDFDRVTAEALEQAKRNHAIFGFDRARKSSPIQDG